jgi:hypothetical protein
VVVDCLGGNEQFPGDVGVGVPGADEREDFVLAPGQAERMLAGGGHWPTAIERMPRWRIAGRMTGRVSRRRPRDD